MSEKSIIICTLIAYKLLLIGVGLWTSRRIESDQDFFLGSQRLGPWIAGLSYAASTSSAWVLLGFTGAVFSQGLVALWLLPGIFSGYVFTWLIIGPHLNTATRDKNHLTIVDYITQDMTPHIARLTGVVCAALILFCFVFYISSQFQAAGNAFVGLFDISMGESVLIGAAIIIIYCLLGGFWAASISDAIQAFVMVVACIIVPLAMFFAHSEVSVFDAASWAGLEDDGWMSMTGESVGFAGIGLAMGMLGTGLGALGQPQLLNRIMATRSHKDRKLGALITIGWGVIIYTGLTYMAFQARLLSLDTGGESLFFMAAQTYLPAILSGLVIAAILSAVMSTVDSLLLSAASAVSHDMGHVYTSPRRALMAGRVAMVCVAALAVVLTLYLPQDIFTRVLFAWVALGAAFGPTILTKALGWQVDEKYRLIAIITGFLIAVIAYNSPGPVAEIFEKWVSWAVGLGLLFLGRKARIERRT